MWAELLAYDEHLVILCAELGAGAAAGLDVVQPLLKHRIWLRKEHLEELPAEANRQQ